MKFKIKRVATAFLRGQNRTQREYIYCRMAANWRQSRHAAWKFAVCFDGMSLLRRVAYIEPKEIEAMTDGCHKWNFSVFTRIQSEKEMILLCWFELYQRFENQQKMVMQRCKIVFNVCEDAINIILEYSKLTKKYSPPKLKWSNLLVIKDESHIAITDERDLCCTYCTIYHNNVSWQIEHFMPALNKFHKRSTRHKKAVMLARKYYNECDYC